MELKKIFGILAFILFILTTTISIYSYEGYKFFEQNFSDLGVGNGAIFFNYGLMLTAIFLAIYFFFSFKDKKILFISLISSIGLFLVGFFPLTFSFEHYISAGIFFVFSFILIIIDLLKSKNKKIVDKKITNKKIIISVIALLIILAYILLQIPVLQKFSVFAIIFWHLYCAFN